MSLNRYIQRKDSLLILRESDSVKKAIDQMMDREAGAVLVAGDADVLLGILTERDVMTRLTAKGLDSYETPVREIMTTKVVTLGERALLDDAISIMRERRIRHLPIIKSTGEILGMLSLRYFLHDTLINLVEEVHELQAYLNDASGG